MLRPQHASSQAPRPEAFRGGAPRPPVPLGETGECRGTGNEDVQPRPPVPVDETGERRGAGDEAAPPGRWEQDASLDPALRHAASLAPIVSILAPPPSNAPLRVQGQSLEELLPALVRRIAWAGDKHRGSVHLELGAGAFAGTTVVVHASQGRVRVELTGREGPDLERLRERVDQRLRERGFDVESVR
jgi:hypothetical protein